MENICHQWWCINPKMCMRSGSEVANQCSLRLFQERIFDRWFFSQFVPSTEDLDGPIALIGDNLESYFSKAVVPAVGCCCFPSDKN